MTNDGGRANEPTSYELRPPNAPQTPTRGTRYPAPAPGFPPAAASASPQPSASPYLPGQTSASPNAAPGHPPAHAPAPGGRGPDSGRLIGGRYRLVGRLGHGGMGTVWRAHDEVVDREVAVKEPRVPDHLNESERDKVYLRMQREARAAARIEHPCVVTMHDVVIEDAKPWIVMELVRGPSLAARLQDGTLDVREAARIGLAVLGALTAAHEAGVLHRDVKPDNVLLGRGDRVVLTDFGIAQVEGEQGLTETGAFVGSPEFVAPERVLGQRPGPESDLWSLGVVLYAAVEGMSPYRRSNSPATLQAVVSAEPQMPARGSGAFGTLVMRLLRKDPGMRPDAGEIRQTLEAVARPPQPVPDPTRAFTGTGAGGGSRWVPPVLHRNRPAQYGILGGLLAVAIGAGVIVADPFGGGDGLPGGWEVRNDREVVSANVAVPSDYRRAQDDRDTSVTYTDPSGVFQIYLERVVRADVDKEIPPTKEAWRQHYRDGGKDRREIQGQKVTVSGTKHQGKDAFDTVVDYVPYSYSSVDKNEVRFRWQERIVATGSGGSEVYWRLRVAGPAEGWAAEEGDKLFDQVVGHLKIEGL
ncbi:serine/threonine-protein kinase [Streptomyces sp. NPDC004609]|uniref:serine/threonine-protein kinase n=1 Tax=Streptomyces sp. NPDC004609 TaxID=3364704 RepID=UPI0036923746